MRPKASILILLTFARLMVLNSVALVCPGVDYMRLWQETLDPERLPEGHAGR
jgi:hypothetical protein